MSVGTGTYQRNALHLGIFQVHAFFAIKKSGVITNSPRSIFRNVDFSTGSEDHLLLKRSEIGHADNDRTKKCSLL